MSTIAEFEFDSAAVPLGRLFEQLPGATVELERVVPFQNRAVSYMWVTGDGERVADGFDPGGGIERLEVVDVLGDETLVRIEWASEETGLTRAIAESAVTLLSAVGTADGWRFSVRGDDRAAVARFHEACSENGIRVRLVSLHRLPADHEAERVHLTDPQREALLLAYRLGYYDSPRTTELSELAEHLGVSRQAVSARLKRGTRTLVEDTLVEPESTG